MIKTPKEFESYVGKLEKAASKSTQKLKVLVSMGTCGLAAGATPIYDAINTEIADKGLEKEIEVVPVGCMGLCHSEPTVEVIDTETNESIVFGNVKVDQVPRLLKNNLKCVSLETIEKTWYYPEYEENKDNKLQAKIVLRNSGRINPEVIDEYIVHLGYKALTKVLVEMKPADVINTVLESGLRGRGGGGFPTGRKWQFAAAQDVEQKYVICNADEGDPGAFMDRAVLEGDPHAVLEAMAITGYAIGADTGIIYIRAEYPLAIERLEKAIAAAREMGFLGKDILGTGFNFDIEIKYGAGAFVCGEETALIHSIEGKRGEPTFKPPFPAVSGLWGKPTIVNNVETFANVCAIIRKGADWFKAIGTEGSPGTKVFALAGKINKVGLIEVPMGITLKEIIFELGKGIASGKEFKAVQTGGPSGGCITQKDINTPIDYDSLKKIGSMMGSGGMIVMDEDDCMVNVARFFLEFTLDESCGKCTPCRIGNKRLHEMLEQITQGKGTDETIEKLFRLSNSIKDTALCGLGQTSPNPVLSTLMNFKDEYMAHVTDKKCPAGVCSELLKFTINDECIGCTMCAKNCPTDAITGERKGQHTIDQEKCIKCGVCLQVCKFHAVDKS